MPVVRRYNIWCIIRKPPPADDVPSRRDVADDAVVMTVCGWLRCPNDDAGGPGTQLVAVIVVVEEGG